MKFTDGLWLKKSGTSLHRAHDMWRYRIEGDEIEVLVPAGKFAECTTLRRVPVV